MDPEPLAAHISQQPACFDFPRREMPSNFSYTGPFHDVRVRPPCPFPWERLTGRRMIYASMGTLQNRLGHVFHAIAEACRGLDEDLVISLGGGGGRTGSANFRATRSWCRRSATGAARQGIADDYACRNEYGTGDAGVRGARGRDPGWQRSAGRGGAFEVERGGGISAAEPVARGPLARPGRAGAHRHAIWRAGRNCSAGFRPAGLKQAADIVESAQRNYAAEVLREGRDRGGRARCGCRDSSG